MLPYWSFVLKRKTLLNQRPKPHDSNFLRISWLKSAVFSPKPRILRVVGRADLSKSAVFIKIRRFHQNLWFSAFLSELSRGQHQIGIPCETKDHLPRKVTPIFNDVCCPLTDRLFWNVHLKNFFFSGCEVCDYGDIEFDYLPDSQDPPMFHIKHPKTNGMMARKVSEILPTVFLLNMASSLGKGTPLF